MISAVLILAMMISGLLQTSTSIAKVENSYLYSGEGYQVVFFITSRWSDGYVADITIQNTGDRTITNQDGVISPEMDNAYLRSVLTWGLNPNDLDSHMVCKFSGGESAHVYYANTEGHCNADLVCQLDVDNTFGYGPETITLQGTKPGIFDYYFYHYYGKGTLSDSNASVCLYLQGTEGMKRYTFHVPEGRGKYWSVYRYNSATETIVSVSKIH